MIDLVDKYGDGLFYKIYEVPRYCEFADMVDDQRPEEERYDNPNNRGRRIYADVSRA